MNSMAKVMKVIATSLVRTGLKKMSHSEWVNSYSPLLCRSLKAGLAVILLNVIVFS